MKTTPAREIGFRGIQHLCKASLCTFFLLVFVANSFGQATVAKSCQLGGVSFKNVNTFVHPSAYNRKIYKLAVSESFFKFENIKGDFTIDRIQEMVRFRLRKN